jgi:hypothetical protein
MENNYILDIIQPKHLKICFKIYLIVFKIYLDYMNMKNYFLKSYIRVLDLSDMTNLWDLKQQGSNKKRNWSVDPQKSPEINTKYIWEFRIVIKLTFQIKCELLSYIKRTGKTKSRTLPNNLYQIHLRIKI